MKKSIVALVGLMLLGGSALAAEAKKEGADEPKMVTVENVQVAAHNKDGPDAMRRGTEAALRDAVNKVVGTTITSQSQTADFTLVSDVIFSQSTGFVSKHEVKCAYDKEEEIATCSGPVWVSKANIEKDQAAIANLLNMKKQRKVFVVINDISTDTVGAKGAQVTIASKHGTFDALVREQLRLDGFQTLDPNFVDGKLKLNSAIQSLANPQQASELAHTVGADLVIYGSATALSGEGTLFPSANGSGGTDIKTGTVRVDLSVTTPDASDNITNFNEVVTRNSTVSGTDALNGSMRLAAQGSILGISCQQANGEPRSGCIVCTSKMGPEECNKKGLRAKLYEHWRKEVQNGQRVSMEITGLTNYAMFSDFKNLLSGTITEVKDIASDRFNKGNGSMSLAVRTNTSALAKQLDGKTLSKGGMKVNVTNVTPNTIEIALSK